MSRYISASPTYFIYIYGILCIGAVESRPLQTDSLETNRIEFSILQDLELTRQLRCTNIWSVITPRTPDIITYYNAINGITGGQQCYARLVINWVTKRWCCFQHYSNLSILGAVEICPLSVTKKLYDQGDKLVHLSTFTSYST